MGGREQSKLKSLMSPNFQTSTIYPKLKPYPLINIRFLAPIGAQGVKMSVRHIPQENIENEF